MTELANAFETVNGLKPNCVYGPRRDGDLPAFLADSAKAKELLGWEANYTVEDVCRSAWNFVKQSMEG